MCHINLKRLKAVALCALMIASLTLGGALASSQFPKGVAPLSLVEKPMDIWPTEYGQT